MLSRRLFLFSLITILLIGNGPLDWRKQAATPPQPISPAAKAVSLSNLQSGVGSEYSNQQAHYASFGEAIVMAPAFAAMINVTTTMQEISVDSGGNLTTNGACSLEEAIMTANFLTLGAPHLAHPDCVATGVGTPVSIVLQAGMTYTMTQPLHQLGTPGNILTAFYNLGNTATPSIYGNIVIEGCGATIARNSASDFRLFSVDAGGSLTLRDLVLKDGRVKGGRGGFGNGGGGGGGLGAGGAVFNRGSLNIERCTFTGNQAIGGTGGSGGGVSGGGGGGGFFGNGGGSGAFGGGGGGGATGSGGTSTSTGGGGGGGTFNNGANSSGVTGGVGGAQCGGGGGNSGGGAGLVGACQGGGGGGGGRNTRGGGIGGIGGSGNYGSGGGGGGSAFGIDAFGGAGNNSGFGGGGGGGGGDGTGLRGGAGGNGGFGGGGGGANGGVAGLGGVFGRNGSVQGAGGRGGGSGAGLGAAVFNDSGTVTILNSTFSGNTVEGALNIRQTTDDAFGTVFSRNGMLTVKHSTFSGNTGVLDVGFVGDGGTAIVELRNNILADNTTNSPNCQSFTFNGGSIVQNNSGNLIEVNGTVSANTGICSGVAKTTDPALTNLTLNAPGKTPTMAITDTSPAFNMGDSAHCLATDQRGVPRLQGQACDIGAFEVNVTPTISPVSVSRTEGTPSANVTIATVLDAEDAENLLTVKINGDNTATVNGVTANNIKVSSTGVVTADVVAACGATTAIFTLRVTDSGGLFAEAPLTVTITPQPNPAISINDVTLAEGNPPGTTAFIFNVTLNAASICQTITVNYATADGTATAGSDYTAASGLLTFAPGVISQTISVNVTKDAIVEANETFFVNLTNPMNAAISDNQGQGRINNDDSATVSINDVTVTEGNAGTVNVTFNVVLSNPSAEQVMVNFATANDTATAGSDYTAATGVLTFAPGATTQTITVPVVGELLVESNETFFVNLSNITGNDTAVPDPVFADNQGQGTINNDDSAAIAINDVTVTEGNAGTVNAAFHVSLSNPSAEQVTINYATANGTATAGSDYTAANGAVTFAPGVTMQIINIQISGDTAPEPNETFFVNLSNIAGSAAAVPDPTFADAQGQGAIRDDDFLSGELTDPLACTGPGNLVTGVIRLRNPAAVTQAFTLNTMFTDLTGLPGSCTLTGAQAGALCTVTANGLTASGQLAANATVTVQYQGQIAAAPGGVTATASSTATVGGVAAQPDPLILSRTINCPPPGPGASLSPDLLNDTKPGSVLFFPVYTSSATGGGNFAPEQDGQLHAVTATGGGRFQNARINLTNTHPSLPVRVHLFFVDGSSCAVSDSYVCLTGNQTTSFLLSDLDPGVTGYLVAVATDRNGCPINFNYLIGSEYVRFASGHAANLAAEAVSAIAGGLPLCNPGSDTAELRFDGVSYNPLPRVLALDNVASRLDGNDTLLIVNRIGGSLLTRAAALGNLFGILYDDTENALSFGFNPGTCQFRASLSNSFPRTAPRFEQFVPAGRSGWLKLYSVNEQALLGAAINCNATANGFNQGHSLHKLTLTNAASLTIPVFPPVC